jgi:hypothetical protein
MQKLLKWFAPLLAFFVAIFIIYFLVSINSAIVINEGEPFVLQSEVNKTKPQKMWIDHFSKIQKQGYSYPVNEVYINVDLDEKIIKTITYKLSASLLDPYQLFCLKEELKRHKLKYYLKQDKQGMNLLIYSQNVNKLKNLVKVLKDYKIVASVKPYKEEY